ncbi:hypothetical protein GCM10009539_60050 [Cryptosporangium japonicum]|uniref:Uncharacterized protein n=1 Tax=Cryptosporangium japonicum TaxID=80872 RepID=A0ABP3EJW1_9ACTN
MPPTVASHRSDPGAAPDGTMATTTALAGTAAFAVGAAVIGAVVAALPFPDATRCGVFATARRTRSTRRGSHPADGCLTRHDPSTTPASDAHYRLASVL